MFGKKFSEYVQFERWILILVALVFAIRIGASLAGGSTMQVRWISMNVVLLVGLFYCSVAVHTAGFGSYKQLLGLLVIQNAFSHTLIAMAIVLGIVTGTDNIFTAPEFFGGSDGKTWGHVLAHLLAGSLLVPLVYWLVGSGVLFLTRRLRKT